MTGSATIQRFLAGMFTIILLSGGMTFPAAASTDSPETVFSPSRLQEIIIDHIEDAMPWEQDRVRIEFLSRIDEMTLRGDHINYRVDALRSENYVGQTRFSVRFYDGGLFLTDQSFRVRIEVLKDFVVATRSLDNGSVVTAGDITVIQRWVDRPPRNRIADPDLVTGMMIRGSIARNAELQERMLRQPQLVSRGDVVRVILSRGGLHMETVGVSVEAGVLGDRIRIRNASSNNVFYARVIDDSVVRVDY